MNSSSSSLPPSDCAGVLIVDDEPNTLALITQLFRRSYPVYTAQSGAEALEILARQRIGVIVADQRMPGMSGTELLREVMVHHPDAVRILLTAYADLDTLTDAINAGRVYQYVGKPWDNRDLTAIVHAAMDTFALRRRNAQLLEENTRLVEELRQANGELERENVSLQREVRGAYRLDAIIGASPAMKHALRVVEKAIESSATVLIGGETGTGKEIVARAIHYNGPRRARKLVAQNCASMPESLLESELFGHARGAFTGAVRDHCGLFEAAHGGTIFLDEIGDMPLAMQAKLLRVLEEGEVRRVGANDPVRVDVRVITATHKDLREEVAAGRFRRDLFYRLDVLRLQLPPLRARDGDVILLARHFFDKYTARAGKPLRGITPAALRVLSAYAFPGNVRELENEIERAVALANPGEALDVDLLSHDVSGAHPAEGPHHCTSQLRGQLRDVERRFILQELARNNGNRTHSAGKLGISVRALQKKIHLLGIKD